MGQCGIFDRPMPGRSCHPAAKHIFKIQNFEKFLFFSGNFWNFFSQMCLAASGGCISNCGRKKFFLVVEKVYRHYQKNFPGQILNRKIINFFAYDVTYLSLDLAWYLTFCKRLWEKFEKKFGKWANFQFMNWIQVNFLACFGGDNVL